MRECAAVLSEELAPKNSAKCSGQRRPLIFSFWPCPSARNDVLSVSQVFTALAAVSAATMCPSSGLMNSNRVAERRVALCMQIRTDRKDKADWRRVASGGEVCSQEKHICFFATTAAAARQAMCAALQSAPQKSQICPTTFWSGTDLGVWFCVFAKQTYSHTHKHSRPPLQEHRKADRPGAQKRKCAWACVSVKSCAGRISFLKICSDQQLTDLVVAAAAVGSTVHKARNEAPANELTVPSASVLCSVLSFSAY